MVQVFISYARKDGAEQSLRLANELNERGISTWRDDRIGIAADFTSEIEAGIDNATHMVVIVTPDVKRDDSFVRLEIGYALTQQKPIIPLVFPGGHRPITIINHTYITFSDWATSLSALLERLKYKENQEKDPQTRRERELAYLQMIGQRYDHWRDLYTDMAAIARVEEPKVRLKPSAMRMIEMRHAIHQQIDHRFDIEVSTHIKTENLAELREGLRKYRRVALIGDPGAGKTTTLQRLAYEYASTAADEVLPVEHEPLPLFARLGAFTGDDFNVFLDSMFGGLSLAHYLPDHVVLLLDGLNEMSPTYHHVIDEWLRINPEVSVIVSCRKLEYIERKLPLMRIDVAPLDLERIQLFMSNYLEDTDRDKLFWSLAGYEVRQAWEWYHSRKPQTTFKDFFLGKDKPGASFEPERKTIVELRQRYREQVLLPDMLGLVTNPFLLQIVIEVFALTGEPPRNRGELFGRFVTLLLTERGKTAVSVDRPWIDETIQIEALATLAYLIQSRGSGTSVSIEFVRDAFQLSAPQINPDQLLFFAVSANILEQTETVRFSHQLVQEYFAAYQIGDDIRKGVSALKYFPSDEWWTPTGWEESALLLAGIWGESTDIVEWLTPVHPDLAFRIATESGTGCSTSALSALYEPRENIRRSPFAVAQWGRLNHKNDNRRGVGLREDGLPDIDWCNVEAGNFIKGADEQPDNPRGEANIEYDFKMARYPITYIQFQAFIDSGEFNNPFWWSEFPSDYQPQVMSEQKNPYNNHPRDRVSWYQAVAFSRWLDHEFRKEGAIDRAVNKIRLPLESEWEYASRGSRGWKYPWGDQYLVGYANVNEQIDSTGPYYLNQTTAVGLYPLGASPFGIYDMTGTVWEWCLNDYHNPRREPGAYWKELRGGSYFSFYSDAACSSRLYFQPHRKPDTYGFRLVIAPAIGNYLGG